MTSGLFYIPSFAVNSLTRGDAVKMMGFFKNPSWKRNTKNWRITEDKSGKYGAAIELLGGKAFLDLCESLTNYFEGKNDFKLMRSDPRTRYMQIFNFAMFFYQKCESDTLLSQMVAKGEVGSILLVFFALLNDIFVLKKDFVTGKKISLDVENTSKFYMVLRQIIMYLFALEAREKKKDNKEGSGILIGCYQIYDEIRSDRKQFVKSMMSVNKVFVKEGELIRDLKQNGTYFKVNDDLRQCIKKQYSDLFSCKEFDDFRIKNHFTIAPYVQKVFSE